MMGAAIAMRFRAYALVFTWDEGSYRLNPNRFGRDARIIYKATIFKITAEIGCNTKQGSVVGITVFVQECELYIQIIDSAG
jgi:hypothetical protein